MREIISGDGALFSRSAMKASHFAGRSTPIARSALSNPPAIAFLSVLDQFLSIHGKRTGHAQDHFGRYRAAEIGEASRLPHLRKSRNPISLWFSALSPGASGSSPAFSASGPVPLIFLSSYAGPSHLLNMTKWNKWNITLRLIVHILNLRSRCLQKPFLSISKK